jgi:hypothetical protein
VIVLDLTPAGITRRFLYPFGRFEGRNRSPAAGLDPRPRRDGAFISALAVVVVATALPVM